MSPAENTKPAPAEALLKVKITKANHEHNGAPCEVGATVEVTAAQAKWLETNKIGTRV